MTYTAGVDYEKNDIPMGIVAEYYGRMEKHRNKKERKRHGQVYTPVEVVHFIVNSIIEITLGQFAEDGKLPPMQAQDPFCGSGIFPLIMLRKLHEATGIPKQDLVEHVIMANDVDLGAVNACKAALRAEVGTYCKTNVEWGDTFAEFFVESEPLAHVTDLDEIDKLNAMFAKDRQAHAKGGKP